MDNPTALALQALKTRMDRRTWIILKSYRAGEEGERDKNEMVACFYLRNKIFTYLLAAELGSGNSFKRYYLFD